MSQTRGKSLNKKSRRAAAKKSKPKAMRAAGPAKLTPVTPDADQPNLNKIDHIVVLVMENRSFDHLLGYLKLESGREVEGLTSSMSNMHNGKKYSVHHLSKTAFKKNQDPCHNGDCVTEQLANDNGGFVSNYAKTHTGDPEVDLVMGYYNGSDLPVYDHLARNYAICERWFCSVDGSTWPNRLYAVTGRAAGSKVNKKVPIYSLPSFVRHLENKKVSWRWYAHDIATLRVTDEKFRVGNFKHFSYFDRHSLPPGRSSFLEDAASGKLAAVSWIDPNFVDLSLIGPSGSNDDHPPSDVMAGQELVLKVYNALANGPKWEKTLLVIVYDEHGGFFDHVTPPPAEDDSPAFRRYGVRVPAFVVSPWVERGKVSNTVFDHTSIIKTILLRFTMDSNNNIPNMGTRVNRATHLGSLLSLDSPRPAVALQAVAHLIERVATWRTGLFADQLKEQARGRAPVPPRLNELQRGLIKAKAQLRVEGLPPGQP
jgi:phospholipase C